MSKDNKQRINDALHQLHEATSGIQGLSVFAMAMPHGKRGSMDVQVLAKGSDTQIAHKVYECMRYSEELPFDLRNVVMTAAAKWLAEQGDEAKQAFDRTVERCREQWLQTQEVKAVIDDCRQVIDEINSEE